MKINIKLTQSGGFELEVDASNTVLEVKEMIKAKNNTEVGAQILIHKGKKFDDAKSLGDYELKEGDTLILMVKKDFKKAEQPPPQALPNPEPVQPAPTNTTAPAPAPQAPNQPPANPGNAMAVGPEMEAVVEQLMGMGFDREQVIAALRAAFFNPDRAVDYLLNGIPEGLQGVPPPQAGGNQGGQNGDEEDDEAAGEDISQEQLTELQNLIQNPAFAALRQQVRHNPQILPSIIGYLQQNNPTLFNLFSQRPELLQALMLGDIGGAGGQPGQGAPRPGQHVIRLTQAESEAIERLMSLGFDKYAAAQAYLSCDKNEDLAANMLLENATEWGMQGGDAWEQPPADTFNPPANSQSPPPPAPQQPVQAQPVQPENPAPAQNDAAPNQNAQSGSMEQENVAQPTENTNAPAPDNQPGPGNKDDDDSVFQ